MQVEEYAKSHARTDDPPGGCDQCPLAPFCPSAFADVPPPKPKPTPRIAKPKGKVKAKPRPKAKAKAKPAKRARA